MLLWTLGYAADKLGWRCASVRTNRVQAGEMYSKEDSPFCNFRYRVVQFPPGHPALSEGAYREVPSKIDQWALRQIDCCCSNRSAVSVFGPCFCVAAPLLSRTRSRGIRWQLFRAGHRSRLLLRSAGWSTAPGFEQAQEGPWTCWLGRTPGP